MIISRGIHRLKTNNFQSAQNTALPYLATMNYVDIVLFLLLAYGAWRGFKKGLIISIFSALALFAGLYGGIHFSDYAAQLLKNTFNLSAEWLPFASFALTFLAILVAVYLLGKAITKALKLVMLGTLNKIAGGIFGVLKMALIVSVSLLILHPLNTKLKVVNTETCEGSLLYHPMYKFSSTLIPAILSSDFYNYIENMEWVPEALMEHLQSDE